MFKFSLDNNFIDIFSFGRLLVVFSILFIVLVPFFKEHFYICFIILLIIIFLILIFLLRFFVYHINQETLKTIRLYNSPKEFNFKRYVDWDDDW